MHCHKFQIDMWRPPINRLGYQRVDDKPEPTIRFASTSGFMGSVPPPPSLTTSNVAALATTSREMDKKKEEVNFYSFFYQRSQNQESSKIFSRISVICY